jgi:hypothetical protein
LSRVRRPDFDGVIAFDEANLMKNAAATKRGGGDWEITFRFADIDGSAGE